MVGDRAVSACGSPEHRADLARVRAEYDEAERRAIEIACPDCRAPAGAGCVTWGWGLAISRPIKRPHVLRSGEMHGRLFPRPVVTP